MSTSELSPTTAEPLYRDEVLEIEPHGLEHIVVGERHGKPFHLFTLWMAANLVLATWVVGNIAVGVFGESMMGAFAGLALGTVLGAVLLGLLSTFGPRLGVPQLVQSRGAFGLLGNFGPGALNYLAGIGWFAVNTVYGTYALSQLIHLNYFVALVIMVVGQVALAVYGYNMIHAFERWMSIALGVVFFLLAIFTFSHGNYGLPFNPKAPVPFGGEIGGFILTVGLGLSYVMGWMPYASDYSRYLAKGTKSSAIIWWSALGIAIPCVLLEWMGALTVSIPMPASDALNPANAIAFLMPGPLAGLALLAIATGTACANALNIYSGAMSALVIRVERLPWVRSGITGLIFAVLAAVIVTVANGTLVSEKQAPLGGGLMLAAAVLVGVVVAVAVRFRMKRWQAAILVGALGGLLSIGGSNPAVAASQYTNFLLLLSYWISPWVAVVLIDWYFKHRGSYQLRVLYDQQSTVRAGAIAWLVGLAASVPFMNQSWYVGVVPMHFPQLGDLTYFVGFIVAAVVFAIFGQPTAQGAPDPEAGGTGAFSPTSQGA